MVKKSARVAWFSEVDKEDIPLVGGKGANLGEMTQAGFPVPNGFVVTATAYYEFLKENDLGRKIKHLLQTVHYENQDSLQQVSRHIKKYIVEGAMSDALVKEITSAYRTLGGVFKDTLVAARSSATAEDLPNASFAGQQETYLNVKGDANLLLKIKHAWASLFNPRAIFYRHEQKFDHFRIGIAIVVQQMVESEKSGIMFTVDPVTNDKTKIVIEAIFGLGEYIVQGKVTPDHYEIEKNNLKIVVKNIAIQESKYVKVGTVNKEVHLTRKQGGKQKITDSQIIELAKLGRQLEKHYYFPQDSEWAIRKNKIYIVQTRPVTTIKATAKEQNHESDIKLLQLLLKGDPASPGIASGPVRVLHNASEIGKVISGEVLVAEQTNPDYVPAMKRAVAIVTDKGGRTSHAAIVSRELGIPAVVGTEKATGVLKTGLVVTVNGMTGDVYKGALQNTEFRTPSLSLNKKTDIKTATHVYVNLAEPELAEKVAQRHVDGVGLLRAEFMIAGIGTHPKKLIHDGKSHVFINKLADDIEQFCRAFNPRPVIYRASDFKTNEYRQLVGGKDYEPQEPNPMLGYRGVYRYISDPAVFTLELDAIKKVREQKGYKNLWLMLPFVRTIKELVQVKQIIAETGLHRSPTFKLWMMVEIPSNVILLEKFIAAGIDGISIGSNDLTMLLLGTDRDNSDVAKEFNEQDETVLWALEHTVKTAHKHNITSSICGQAPSLYPSLVEKLVSWGITSVSVSPDAIESVRETIAACERKLIEKKTYGKD